MRKKLSLNALHIDSVNVTDTGATVEGYAAHFNKVNGNGEIVDENSFTKFFEELKAGGLMPAFNWQHNSDRIIGGWDSITADAEGLKVVGHLNTESKFVRDEVLPLLKAGDVASLSTEGFSWFEDWEEREDGFYIKNFSLTAIALVALPADFGARVSLKNEYREWERGKHKDPKPIFY